MRGQLASNHAATPFSQLASSTGNSTEQTGVRCQLQHCTHLLDLLSRVLVAHQRRVDVLQLHHLQQNKVRQEFDTRCYGACFAFVTHLTFFLVCSALTPRLSRSSKCRPQASLKIDTAVLVEVLVVCRALQKVCSSWMHQDHDIAKQLFIKCMYTTRTPAGQQPLSSPTSLLLGPSKTISSSYGLPP